MTIYIAGVFQLDTVMAALENTFGKESRREAALVPPRPDIVHTYARPEGERVRTFLHDLQTQFACTLELIEPLDDYKTEADYERETCDQLAGLCLEDRIDQIRSSSADPPFTSISWDAACDAVFCCKSVSLSVSARPHDWKGAMTVAVTELCKLGQFGISADELALAKSTLLKDMEDDAEQNDTIPSLDWLEDLMDRETLHVRCAQTRKMRLRTDTCAHALTRMQCQLIRTDGPSDRGVSSSLVTEVSHRGDGPELVVGHVQRRQARQQPDRLGQAGEQVAADADFPRVAEWPQVGQLRHEVVAHVDRVHRRPRQALHLGRQRGDEAPADVHHAHLC